MIINLLILLVLALLTLVFLWLLVRSFRSHHKVLKWFGVFITAVFSLLFLAVTVTAARGLYIIYSPRPAPQVNVQVNSTPEKIARGQYLAQVVCIGCHSSNQQLPLSGAHTNFADETGLPLGSLYPANLTPGGEVGTWTDADLFRALRYNIRPGQHTLLMPVQGVRALSDADAEAVIAFLRSQPAVQYTPPATQPSVLMAVFVGLGAVDVTPKLDTTPVIAPPKAATAEYGQYVVAIMGCRDCHGNDLHGGKPPAPPAPDLVVVKGWTQDQFVTALRTGVVPGGSQLSNDMPWREFSRLEDVELQAAHAYLRSLPAK
jgi:mono/diheme cytochrome c family protein